MLIACNSMVSGYRCVLKDSHTTLGLKNPYRVQVRRDGRRMTLGRFGNAAEAALCYVRSPEGQVEAASSTTRTRQITATAAREEASLSGMKLLPSRDNTSGFRNVGYDMGKFKAALCFARSVEGNPVAGPAAGLCDAEKDESLRQPSGTADPAFAATVANQSLVVTTHQQQKKRKLRSPFGASTKRRRNLAASEKRARKYEQGFRFHTELSGRRIIAGGLFVSDKHDTFLAPALGASVVSDTLVNRRPAVDTDGFRAPGAVAFVADCRSSGAFSSLDSASRPASPFSVLRAECEAVGDDRVRRAAWFASFCA